MTRQTKNRMCPACGHARAHAVCPISSEVREALADFAAEHGTVWRSRLRSLWINGQDEGALRMARNVIGPSALEHVDPKHPEFSSSHQAR